MYCILQGNASVSLIDFLYPVYLIHTKEKHSPWDFFQNCISLFILVCENCEIWSKNRRWYCFCSRFDMPYQNHITCTWIEYQMFFSKQQVLRSRYTQNVHTLRGMYAQKRKIAQNQKMFCKQVAKKTVKILRSWSFYIPCSYSFIHIQGCCMKFAVVLGVSFSLFQTRLVYSGGNIWYFLIP